MKKPDSKTNQKPIRVAFFHRKPRYMGNFSIENYFQQIREHLPQPFQPVYVEMPYESNGLWPRLANTIYCYFKQEDINHITGDIHYVAAFLKKKKTVLTIHDCGSLHRTTGIKRKILKYLWFKMPLAKSSQITANSIATKTEIVKLTGFPSSKIEVVYICAGKQYYPQKKVFNHEHPRILQVGTGPSKNLKNTILSLKGINCTLVIVGKVSRTYKALVRENNIKCEYMEFPLSKQEILEQYYMCDFVCHASTSEGFGLPIIEANAIGRPVLSSNISSMPEVAGDAALLVNPFDVTSIAEGVLKIIHDSNLREQLIMKGLKNHIRFQPKQLAAEYTQLYYKLIM